MSHASDFDLWAREIAPDPYNWAEDDGSGLVADDEPGLLLRGIVFATIFELAVAVGAGALFWAGFSVVRWLVGA